jgi:two-component system sensor histidine kinase KdpD
MTGESGDATRGPIAATAIVSWWRTTVPACPLAERDAIFEKLRRGGASSGSGAGLGLAICRAIVRAHGGEITAEGRGEEPGLHVIVELPCSPAPPDAEDPS